MTTMEELKFCVSSTSTQSQTTSQRNLWDENDVAHYQQNRWIEHNTWKELWASMRTVEKNVIPVTPVQNKEPIETR